MKQTIMVMLALGLIFSFVFAREMQPGSNLKVLPTPQLDLNKIKEAPQSGNIAVRTAPQYTFTTNPTAIMTNYYDYMIGNYNGLPLRVIPYSQGGGYFMTYHGRRAPTSIRRAFYTYVDANGNVVNNNEIATTYINEGYSTLAVDPVSGKPLYAWHANHDADPELEVLFASDAFIGGISGLINDVEIAIDNPQTVTAPNGLTTYNNEFIWPTVQIGPSPVVGKRRVYIAARNSVSPSYGPSESVMIAYADFDGDQIEAGVPMAWNRITIPEIDAWNVDFNEWRRPFLALTTDNAGNLYYVGYHSTTDGNGQNTIIEPDIDIFVCPNYGQGTWSRVTDYSWIQVSNPPATIGGEPFFQDDGGAVADDDLVYRLANTTHANASVDNLGRVHFFGVWALSTIDGVYWPAFQVVKEFVFDPANQSIIINDVHPKRHPDDIFNETFVPWDMEAPFGEPEYSMADDGNHYLDIVLFNSHPGFIWPFPHWDQTAHDDAMMFHYSNTKITNANGHGMMAAVWQDSQRARWYNVYDDVDYMAYSDTPEIFIAVSANNGYTWSEPIKLNNQEVPQLSGIKPMWVYPADQVIYTGTQGNNVVGKLGLMFYDDFTWGTDVLNPHIYPDGGRVMFMELEIVFATGDEPMTALIGTVTSDGTPLQDAYVSIDNGAYHTTTNDQGQYHFYYVAPGTHTVTATKLGYEPQNLPVTLVYHETTILDFDLIPSESVSVMGYVVGSDQPTVGLEGAHIVLSGITNHSGATDATGHFNIPGVLTGNTYNYRISKQGYQEISGSIDVGFINYVMGTLVLPEFAYPPSQVVATESLDQIQVNLVWNPPSTAPASRDLENDGLSVNTEIDFAPKISHEFIKSTRPTFLSINHDNREYLGYRVWRLLQGQENNESAWTQITSETITATSWQDDQWNSVVDGTYKWAVKAIYPGDEASAPAFSNSLSKVNPKGTISGIVLNHHNSPIVGATVTCGDVSATTYSSGYYSIQVSVGTHSVTASAPGYETSTQGGLTVLEGQTTTVNFQLSPIIISHYFEDSFESYPNFATSFGPWTTVDVDMSETYGIQSVDFPGTNEPMAFMIFNPSATVPPSTTISVHSGEKMAASFAAVIGPNNDWLITPMLLGHADIRFWAKSHTSQYGLERFRVGVSTGGTHPNQFTIISGPNYLEAPEVWTEYVFSLCGYTGQIYVGIQCVSNDAFIFFVDDVQVFPLIPSTDDPGVPVVATALHGNYPNPFNPETTVTYSVKDAGAVSIEIYNAKGQLVKTLVNEHKATGNYSIVWNGSDNNNQAVSSGVYFYKMLAGKYSSTRKMILMK